MSSLEELEDEVNGLRESNAELVQIVQQWKTTGAQWEAEKRELVNQVNHLKLKLGKVCRGSEAQMRALESALKKVTEKAVYYLEQATNQITQTLDITHNYISDRQDLEKHSPQKSILSTLTKSKKIRRVRPMIGGRTIHPIVVLSALDMSTLAQGREPQNQNETEPQVLPMNALQVIPLPGIDTADLPNNEEGYRAETLGPDDSGAGRPSIPEEEDPMNVTHSRQVNVLYESNDSRPETKEQRNVQVDPLEGPSWLSGHVHLTMNNEAQVTHEADSTTETDEDPQSQPNVTAVIELEHVRPEPVQTFTTTLRRRERNNPPPQPSPSPAATKRRRENRESGSSSGDSDESFGQAEGRR